MERIKIGIVGLNFGMWIVDKLLNGRAGDYFEVAALCDRDAVKVKAMAEKLGVTAYTDLDELLQNDEISVIGLFTGPAGRAGLIRKIIHAGKDVLTTKPFELDSDEALQVLQEAREKQRIVHLNSPSPRLSQDLLQIKEWSAQYNLGSPVGCRCETWASYKEKADGSWYDDSGKCPVAPIFRIGIYLINDLVALFGEADKVQVIHSQLFTGRPTPDNAMLGILFKNGALANVYASFCINDGQFYKNSMVVNYENGTVYRNIEPFPCDDLNRTSRMSLITRDDENKPLQKHAEFEGLSGDYQWNEFYCAIKERILETDATPNQVAEAIKIIHAMARAEKSGSVENV